MRAGLVVVVLVALAASGRAGPDGGVPPVRREVGEQCALPRGGAGMWDWKDPLGAPGYWSCIPAWKEGDSCAKERMAWPDGRLATGTWRLRNQVGGWSEMGPRGGEVRTIVYPEKYWTCEPPAGHDLVCGDASKPCVVVRRKGGK